MTTGFHDGELLVQARAGVTGDAARLEAMLDPTSLDGGARIFLLRQRLVALTSTDRDGVLWTSARTGQPGFLDCHGTTLEVRAAAPSGDPLAHLRAGADIGIVAIDFMARRRIRVNGKVAVSGPDRLSVDVEQAYGNCPQYIHPHAIDDIGTDAVVRYDGSGLTADHERIITSADAFFLGTRHPTRGADASHRGGEPGFVTVESGRLRWADYPGNNMFNSMGNLAVDPVASVLFLDFHTGQRLHITGTARTDWTDSRPSRDGRSTGRSVEFSPAHVVLTGSV